VKTRRLILIFALVALVALVAAASMLLFGAKPIDREALVRRHTVHVTGLDAESALSVGNGDFAFTVGVTGLQCFDSLY
jgi:hypothetical protein